MKEEKVESGGQEEFELTKAVNTVFALAGSLSLPSSFILLPSSFPYYSRTPASVRIASWR